MLFRKLFILNSDPNNKTPILYSWQKQGTLLSLTGSQRRLSIVDRQAKFIHQVSLSGITPASQMGWNCDGDIVALIQHASSSLSLYSTVTKRMDTIDAKMKEITAMAWSPVAPVIAVGGSRGELELYNRASQRRNQLKSPFNNRIIEVLWSNVLTLGGTDENSNSCCVLAVLSDEKSVALLDTEGTVTAIINLRGNGTHAEFGVGGNASLLAVNIGKSLFVMDVLKTKDAPMELSFSERYGEITVFSFCKEGVILVGFSKGYALLMSVANDKTLGKELSCYRASKEPVILASYCITINQCCTGDRNSIYFYTLDDTMLSGEKVKKLEIKTLGHTVNSCSWVEGGDIVSVGTEGGTVCSFLTKLPVLSAHCEKTLLFLSSPRELTIHGIENDDISHKIQLGPQMEPNLVSMSSTTVAIGLKNEVCLYSYDKVSSKFRGRIKYQGIVENLRCSSRYIAVTVNGEVDLRPIDGSTSEDSSEHQERQKPIILPDKSCYGSISDVVLSDKFISMSTSDGHILNYLLEGNNKRGKNVEIMDGADNYPPFLVVDYTHTGSGGGRKNVKTLTATTLGNRIAFIDTDNNGWLLNLNTEIYTHINGFTPDIVSLHWDVRDSSVLVGCSSKGTIATTFVYAADSRAGSVCDSVKDFDAHTLMVKEGKNRSTTLPSQFRDICVSNGVLKGQSDTGSLISVTLVTHTGLFNMEQSRKDGKSIDKTLIFMNALNLNMFPLAAHLARTKEHFTVLAYKALNLLDIETAIKSYRYLNSPTLVWALERLSHIKEKNILLGHIAVINGDFVNAQLFFTRSSQPLLALELRRDLLQWEQALQLAKQFAPNQVPQLSREYAQQLEFGGEYAKALQVYLGGKIDIFDKKQKKSKKNEEEDEKRFTNYQKEGPSTSPPSSLFSLTSSHPSSLSVDTTFVNINTNLTTDAMTEDAATAADKHHNDTCDMGVARCMIRTGNVKDGVALALSVGKGTSLECAKLLEESGHYEEAASLYEKTEEYEKAATIYITKTKNIKAAGRLLPCIKSRNILVLYAEAKEKLERNYSEAEKAYELAEDWENVVRLKVEHLKDLHGAYVIVRKTRSADAALIVAKMCKKQGEHGAAVEFLVMAKKTQQAFEYAKSINKMDFYEKALLGSLQLIDGVANNAQDAESCVALAQHYDRLLQPRLAGEYYQVAGDFTTALERYMAVNTAEGVEKAVELVGKVKSDVLIAKLTEFLKHSEEAEGSNDAGARMGKAVAKDPMYLFKLYVALGNSDKAARMAISIGAKEQEAGNYRAAHESLLNMTLILQRHNLIVRNDIKRTLVLVHSYMIVKHIKKNLDDANNATRILLRVARNIEKFPAHIPIILTSVVLQCIKYEFRASSYQYALMLVQNEQWYNKIDEQYRRKIDNVVRKRGGAGIGTSSINKTNELTDPVETLTPCPFCNVALPETQLECESCKNVIPFCVVTGKHMTLEDWSGCPRCKFPALFSSFQRLLRDIPQCPMCEQRVDINEIVRERNPELRKDLQTVGEVEGGWGKIECV